jgi:hypothetical protein
MKNTYSHIARMKTVEEFQRYSLSQGAHLPIDSMVEPAPSGALAQPYVLKSGRSIGNRFCIHPMEGWDGTTDGRPTDFVTRRWKNFGRSGAKLIWGGEAAAVRPDGRANPNQLCDLLWFRNIKSYMGKRMIYLLACSLPIRGVFANPMKRRNWNRKFFIIIQSWINNSILIQATH